MPPALPVCSPGADGHIHELGSLEIVSRERKEEDAEVTALVRKLFEEARDNEIDPREKAEESEKFYRGEQWSDKDRNELKAQRRACLTINETEGKIDLLSGYQRQNRSDIKFLPVEGGDQRIADILNIVVKNICDQNDFEYQETFTFEDMAITGRGLFHTYVDYDDNILGDIKIEHFPWNDVFFGPHLKADASDCEYLVKTRWYSKAKIEQMFPEKAKEITREFALDGSTADKHQGATDEYATGVEISAPSDMPSENKTDPDYVDIARKEIRVLECWRKEFERVPVVFNAPEKFYLSGKGMKEEDVASAKSIPGLRVVHRKVNKIRVTSVANTTLLSDEYSDIYKDLAIIPAYAKKRGKFWWGKIEGIKDVQREINKRHSQIVDILSRVAAYGWFIFPDTFENASKEAEFKRICSTAGFVARVTDRNRKPEMVEGVKFPNELAALEELSSMKLREILNINQELLGLNSKAESGVAQVEKKRQGLIGNEFLFDNMDHAKKTLGRIVVGLIQKVYDPDRILRVVQTSNSRAPVQIANQPLDQYDPNEILEMLKNDDLTKYDVAVTESAHSPTQRRANFVAWADLAGKGIPVPPEMLVDLSDLPDKEKVKQAIAAMQKAKMEMEQKKLDVEIQKTMIAKQAQGAPAKA